MKRIKIRKIKIIKILPMPSSALFAGKRTNCK